MRSQSKHPETNHVLCKQCSSQLASRNRWYGCPRKSRSIHWTIKAGPCWGDWGERRKQTIFPYVCKTLRWYKHLTTRVVSGGFAVVQPDSQLSINAVEGFPLEDFSADAVRNQITEAQKIASGSGSEQDVAEAKIELEVRLTVTIPTKYVLT